MDKTFYKLTNFHSQVYQFLSTLKEDLTLAVGNRMDSVLGQAMYFGLSFSRVGVDFRGLLVPIFQNAILSEVKKKLTKINEEFVMDMQSFTLFDSHGLMLSGIKMQHKVC